MTKPRIIQFPLILELSVKSPCLHLVFGHAFISYPLFQWYPQSKENWLNLNMKCWNSAFNAQGWKLIIVVVEVVPVKRKDRMKLSLPPKLVGKLVWVPVISLCKIPIPSHGFDPLLCINWPFSPLNRETFRITLLALRKLVSRS